MVILSKPPDGGPFGLSKLVEGLATNPVAAFNMLDSHLNYVFGYVVSAGSHRTVFPMGPADRLRRPAA